MDVSLENFFLGSSNVGSSKLGDLGFACEVEEGELITFDCGKEGYAPPEITAKKIEPYDPFKVDVFCLGVCLWMCLTGKMTGNMVLWLEK